MSKVVIVGGGHAGFSAAAGLRSNGHEGEILIVSEEAHMPYHRPPLSKALLVGGGGAGDIALGKQAFYDRNDIRVRLGTKVTAIDCAVRVLSLAGGGTLGYDRLILALGAENRRLPMPGAGFPNVLSLRSYDDAVAARGWLGRSDRVAVIGGGFVGLELASAANRLGRRVTVIEASDRLMSRAVSPEISAHYLNLHRSNGVDVRLNAKASRIEGDRAASAVVLEDGTRIGADLVFVGVGIRPADRLAAEAGIATQDGILVDGHMRTSAPGVHAVGDCARFPSRHGGLIRVESVQNAVDQGLLAARDIAGTAAPYAPVHWFWSDQFGVKLQMATIGRDGADRRIAGDVAGGKFTVYAFDDGVLTGAESVGRPADHARVRKLLERGATASDILED